MLNKIRTFHHLRSKVIVMNFTVTIKVFTPILRIFFADATHIINKLMISLLSSFLFISKYFSLYPNTYDICVPFQNPQTTQEVNIEYHPEGF